MKNIILKLSAGLWLCCVAASLITYGLQAEKVMRKSFSLKDCKAEYQDIVQANTLLSVRAADGAGLKGIEDRVSRLGYVSVPSVKYIAVPYDMLALRRE